MVVSFLESALFVLLSLCREAFARDRETHAYLLGRWSHGELVVATVLRAGAPVEQVAMTRPDYGASAVAMQPHLDRGEQLLGEAHLHHGLVGLSAGDRHTLLAIPGDRFPSYLAVVVTMFADGREPVLTVCTALDGRIIEHRVQTIEHAYPVCLPPPAQRVLLVGAGSGGCLLALQLSKLPFAGLTILDGDSVELRNLERHIATPDDVGAPKAPTLTAFLRPRAAMPVYDLAWCVTPATLPALTARAAEHELLIDATGHPPTSILANRAALAAGRPALHAGVYARGRGGFVFLQSPGRACYECLYDLQREQTSEDPATLAALANQYGYTERELAAQQGLWTDVNLVSSLAAKVTLEWLKYGAPARRPNLYVVDNDLLTITSRHVRQHEECTCHPNHLREEICI